jgi:nitrate/nitrite transporter NarK
MLGVTADRFPQGGASMFGLLAAAGNAGCFFMPWIVGMTADASSLRYGLATATFCPAIMVLLLLWMGARRPQPADVPAV